MSDKNGNAPKLDLNSSLRVVDYKLESPTRSKTMSPASPPSSCASTNVNQDDNNNNNTIIYPNSPEVISMVLVGCPRCLMYVMLNEGNLKCPKCKNTALINFLKEDNNNNNSIIKKG